MIYLYIKTHNITGLKYFGKTTQNPFKYKGSGKYWKAHLKKYGYDVSTEIIFETENLDEIQKVALNFSKENNIVISNEWANLIEENGIDSAQRGHTYNRGRKHSEKFKIMRRDAMIGNKIHKGFKNSEETKVLISIANKGKRHSQSEETKKQISKKLKGNMHFKGHVHSKETKIIMRNIQLNIKPILCIFCNKEFKPAHFKRWHGENCKENLNNAV